MSKELYMDAVEELVAEGMSYEEASDKAWDRARDKFADMIDRERRRRREQKQ